MNTKHTRQMNRIRRALGIGALCLVASVGFSHAESIAIPSARPMVDGVSADVETVNSSSKGQQHINSDVITPNDWTYTALQRLIKHDIPKDMVIFETDPENMYVRKPRRTNNGKAEEKKIPDGYIEYYI